MQFVSDVKELDNNIRTQIGQRIQESRMKAGMSGADLGAYLGISGNQVSRIETGKVKCSLEHIFILTQVLDCTADYLLFGKKPLPTFSQEQVDLISNLYQSIQI